MYYSQQYFWTKSLINSVLVSIRNSKDCRICIQNDTGQTAISVSVKSVLNFLYAFLSDKDVNKKNPVIKGHMKYVLPTMALLQIYVLNMVLSWFKYTVLFMKTHFKI